MEGGYHWSYQAELLLKDFLNNHYPVKDLDEKQHQQVLKKINCFLYTKKVVLSNNLKTKITRAGEADLR